MRAVAPATLFRLAALSGAALALTAGPASAAPPPAPNGLSVEATGPTRAPSTRVTWVVPAGTPADTTARWRACPDGGTCTTGSSSEP